MYKKINISFQLLFILGGIGSFLILMIAYFLEYFLKLEPCPLCLLQRYSLLGICVLFWIGALYPGERRLRFTHNIGIMIFCMLGIIFSARHVWLQYVAPPLISNCLAGFEKMLAFLSFWEIVKEIFTASPECAHIDFTFLKLSLPGWALITFLGFSLFILSLGWLQIKRRI